MVINKAPMHTNIDDANVIVLISQNSPFQHFNSVEWSDDKSFEASSDDKDIPSAFFHELELNHRHIC